MKPLLSEAGGCGRAGRGRVRGRARWRSRGAHSRARGRRRLDVESLRQAGRDRRGEVQPVPWVCRCRSAGSPNPRARRGTSTSRHGLAGEMPALYQHRAAAEREQARRPRASSSTLPMSCRAGSRPPAGSGSARRRAAISSRFSGVDRRRIDQRAPPLATMTGSTTSGIAGRARRSPGDRLDDRRVVQHAGLDRVGADVVEHDSICWRTKSGGIGRTPKTP